MEAYLNLEDAEKIAAEVIAVLRPLCLRCEVAGSVRRKKPSDIKDLEVVSIPNPIHAFELRRVVNSQWGEPRIGKWPSKYTQIRARWNLDLFWGTPENWGLLFVIRTGPAPFCERLLSFWKQITKGGYSEDGILHLADGTPVPTPEEEDVFKVLEHYGQRPCPFIAPERRLANKH